VRAGYANAGVLVGMNDYNGLRRRRMTPTARHWGAANLLVCIAILAIGSLLIGLLISSLFHRSLGESFRIACVFLTGLSMILSLILWLLGLHAAGRVLLDCGPTL
jgi:hypothetical protein